MYRNGLAPISRLATEILCRIFDHLRRFPETIVICAFEFQRNALEWIRVTQVCHEWREIAINCPSPWTRLPFDFSNTWIKKILQRSQSASLYVNLDYSFDRFRKRPVLDTARIALSQTWRIYSLHIIYANSGTFQKLVSHLPKSAPKLEVLMLLFNDDSEEETGSRPPHDIRFKLPDDSLNEMDRLCSLEIVACSINWEKHLSKLNRLTFLRIENINLIARPAQAHFWNALSYMSPTLEKLHLCDTFPLASKSESLECSDNVYHGRLAFPSLQDLCVQSTSKELKAFLDGVTLSTITTVFIKCVDSTVGGVLRSFCDAIECSPTNVREMPVLETLDISGVDDFGTLCVTVKLFPKRDPSPKHYTLYPPKYALAFALKATRYNVTPAIETLWTDIFVTLPMTFADFPQLEIQWDDQDCVESIRIPEARRVFETTARLAFDALRQPSISVSKDASARKADVLMPNVKHITITGLHFGTGDKEFTPALLIDCFSWRKMHGAKRC